MDYQYKEKIKDNTIAIAIMHTASEYKEARKLKNMIEDKYKNGIAKYKIKPILVNYKDIHKAKVNLYYLLPTNKENVLNIVKQASTQQAITFSYRKDALKYGVMISLDIAKKIKPLLNLKAIKKNNITFRPMLIKISTIFSADLGSSLQNSHIRNFLYKQMYRA